MEARGPRLLGYIIVGFALAAMTASILLAMRGYVIASLIAVAVGSVSLIIGSDLARGEG